MKTKCYVLIFLLAAAFARGHTNNLTSLLQQGLLEEQANHNLDAAIADYQSLATQFDKDRQLAATAVFRLGECYRAQGKTNEATAQYQRIISEFPDQKTLEMLSRQNLTGMGATIASAAPSAPDQTTAATDDENQEIRRIQQMIQNSPDLINAPAEGGILPLRNAARNGRLKVAAFLLDHGAEINLVQTWAALHDAAIVGNRAMAELLLSRGADVSIKADNGQTPLDVAVEKGFQAVIEVLLANKADVNASGTYERNAPLHLAARHGQAKIIQMLLAAGANPNAENKNGRTPLSFAAENGSPETVKILLDAKADPTLGKLDAPLLCAIHKQDSASAELLLHAGANPNAKGAVEWSGNINGSLTGQASVTPLYLAISTKQSPMVRLLLKFKADPNDSQTEGLPMLFNALPDTNMLEALLDAGADPNRPDMYEPKNGFSQGESPLMSAVGNSFYETPEGNLTAARLLIAHGANPNARSQDGNTALHWVVGLFGLGNWKIGPGKREIVELLLDHHADPNARNNEGKTPLDLLKRNMAQDSFTSYSPNTISEQKAFAKELADLLRRRGALDYLPNWDRITVSRPSADFSFTVFRKGTNDWNRFTLLEMILNYYASSQTISVPQGNNSWANYPANSMMPFPDLTRVIIARPGHGSTNETRMAVNLLDSTDGIDCSKDVPLEFGDVVEIPERNHSLGDGSGGLTGSQGDAIVNYLKGNVQLVFRNQKVGLPLYPNEYQSSIGAMLGKAEAKKLLLSSSDLSRVKVSRRDPKTGKKREWILDCNPQSPSYGLPGVGAIGGNNPRPVSPPPLPGVGLFGGNNPPREPGLWLRDGDVIEVPEKP